MPSAALTLPEPIGLQPAILESPSPRKVLRIGRRGTKTRANFLAAVCGHGPGWYDGRPALPGILQGRDVVWLAADYPQLIAVVWNELIVPRFDGLPYATLNKTEHTLALNGLGTLYLRPSTAVDSVRGMGSRLVGAILDEAAHWDLKRALQDIVLPALLDHDGWLVISSTTNADWDGNADRTTPSYFNTICEEIQEGTRTAPWVEFYGTAFDNPVLNKSAIHALIAEYAPGSASLRQEVYAELLRGGVGRALPWVSEATHLEPPFDVPAHWPRFAAFDWGYEHPWAFGVFAADPYGTVHHLDTVWGRREQPAAIVEKVAKSVSVRQLERVIGGLDLWHEHKARGLTGPTLAEAFQDAGWPLVKADTDRTQGLAALRRYTSNGTPDAPVKPSYRLFPTPGNRRVLAQLEAMQLDPKDREKPLKVDAVEGQGGDDGADMVRYALMSRPAPAVVPVFVPDHPDRSRGIDPIKHRPRPVKTAEGRVADWLGTDVSPTVGRVGRPRR